MAYAIWAGLGTVFVVVIGMIWFREPAMFVKIASIGLIILGVVDWPTALLAHAAETT